MRYSGISILGERTGVRLVADANVLLSAVIGGRAKAVMEQLALTAAGQPTNQGFVISYERKGRGLDPPVFGGLVGSVLNWVRDRFPSGEPPVSR